LGAKSLKNVDDLKNKKRHPTILNDVTIYSNSTVLGGDTIVGDGCIIGANKLITESIPSGTRVI
jgi:serine O-acetyltransferase